MGLKWPLSRDSQFKLHFYLGLEKPRIAPKFSRHLFSRDYWLIILNHQNLTLNPNAWWYPNWLYIMQYFKVKNYIHFEIISRLSHFSKVKLKWPLSRDSHFKIHFGLEFRENQGLSQNFHRVLFLGDCKIITPSHTICSIFIINACYTYLKHAWM